MIIGRWPFGLVILSFVCVLATRLSADRADQAEAMTLSTAIKEALAHNDRLVGQNDAIEQAKLGVALARNTFRPKVIPNIQGSFGQTDVSNQTYRVDVAQKWTAGTEARFGVGASTAQIPRDGGTAGLPDIRFYNADTTLMISQPLLRGFGAAATRRSLVSAEARQLEAERTRVVGEQTIAIEVAAAYYRLIAQQAFVEVANKSLDRARKLLEAAEAKLAAGIVSQLDVLRGQSLLSQSEIQLLEAQGTTEDARDQLNFLIGRPASQAFDVSGEIPTTGEDWTVDEAIALALDRRLDLKSAVAAADESERTISFSRNQLLPQLDVSLSLTRRQTAQTFASSFGLNQFQLAPFFSLSMPVDRTPQQIEYQNALIERDRQTRQIATLRSRIGDDVRRVLRARERMLKALRAAELGVQIGRQEVDVAQLRYDRGLSNNLDVVNAEAGLLAAEGRRLQVLAELAVANLTIRATLGILDPRVDIVDPAPKK